MRNEKVDKMRNEECEMRNEKGENDDYDEKTEL